jgi:hypothetical protein
MTHDGSHTNIANDWDIDQNASFEQTFGISGPYAGGQWDVTPPVNGGSGLVSDITLHDSLTIPNGDGGQNGLAREATTALLNLLDSDTSDAFMTSYVYQREHYAAADSNADANLSGDTPDQIKDDLIKQVQEAFNGGPDAHYTIAELTDLLSHTHE